VPSVSAVELPRKGSDGATEIAQGNDSVLTRVNLDVPHGAFIAINGESGSGKSTLLNIIGLLTRFRLL